MSIKIFQAKDLDISELQIINDGVMGGKSQGFVEKVEDGLRFYGEVSLANNGGFSSFRMPFQQIDISAYSKFKIKLKGDGKSYQFRVQETPDQKHNYVVDIPTDQEQQEIQIDFEKMKPQFRGKKLDIPHFKGENLSRIGFMILPGKATDFELIVQEIILI